LQQYTLEPQLSLLPGVVQAMVYDTSGFDIADLLDFFQSLGNASKLLLSEVCTLAKLMLVIPVVSRLKVPALNHGRSQA